MPYEPKAVILLRMSHALKDALDAYALKQDISTSEAVRLAVYGLVGLPGIPTHAHGNQRYATEEARKTAARARKRARKSLARQLGEEHNAI